MTSIVVIDDDRLMRERVISTLEIKGYRAVGAADGEAGVMLIRDYVPDLVLCDVNMPCMDGYSVLQYVRYDAGMADIPFIFLTARDKRDDMRRGMSLGADDYLPKPFTTDELLAAVQAQLDKREALKQKYEQTIHLLRKNIIYALPHELRTPLSGSLGYAELLRMDADSLGPDEVRDLATRIVNHNRRLHRVLENFLIYAQIEVLAADPERLQQLRNFITPQAGTVVAARAMEIAQMYERENDLVLETDDVALLIADDNLDKIALELVDNAFKFSPPGSPVAVRTARDDDVFIIVVRDRGRGMASEQIASIGAYMQFDRVLYEQQGLGMGLIIAKRLIELHDGQLAIHSEPQHGTEVRVSIPLYP